MLNPLELTEFAIKNNELDKFLLGEPPYAYRDRWSSATAPNDVTTIFSAGIRPYAVLHPEAKIKEKIEDLIPVLSTTTDGLDVLVSILFTETYARSEGRTSLGINLENLSQILRKQVAKHADLLRQTFERGGLTNPEGLYGDFKRLSKTIAKHGGSEFI